MYQLEVPGECAQALEDPSAINEEEEKLLTSKSILAVGGTLLPFNDEVKKPLMEDFLDSE
jgi:hypothetical protein